MPKFRVVSIVTKVLTHYVDAADEKEAKEIASHKPDWLFDESDFAYSQRASEVN